MSYWPCNCEDCVAERALEQDAARYRQLRHTFTHFSDKHRLQWYLPYTYNTGKSLAEQLDESVDLAIQGVHR